MLKGLAWFFIVLNTDFLLKLCISDCLFKYKAVFLEGENIVHLLIFLSIYILWVKSLPQKEKVDHTSKLDICSYDADVRRMGKESFLAAPFKQSLTIQTHYVTFILKINIVK